MRKLRIAHVQTALYFYPTYSKPGFRLSTLQLVFDSV